MRAIAYAPFPAPVRGAMARRYARPRRIVIPSGLGALSPGEMSIANTAAAAAQLTGELAGGPLGGAIAGAIAQVGLLLANVFSGCGQTCVEASNLANQAEPLLLQNLQTYMSAPVHYASLQAAALNNFALTWQALVQACSNPQLGSAGQSCIADRQQGGCHYQTSPGGWSQDASGVWSYTYPGAQGSGSACWNWFVGYHDPIANDPTVVPDPVPGGGALTSTLESAGLPASVFGLPTGDVAIGAGLLLLAWLFL